MNIYTMVTSTLTCGSGVVKLVLSYANYKK